MKKQRELGAGMVEFALVVALVATIGFASVEKLGEAVRLRYCDASKAVAGASSSDEPCGAVASQN